MPTETSAPTETTEETAGKVDLSQYDNAWYYPGRSFLVRLVWHCVNALILQTPLNASSRLKVFVLRAFGARIGVGAGLKPGVSVKYPWNLRIGDHSWIGENVWLDSLAPIEIGAHCCVSQDAYFCTGNHDWTDPHFGLIIKPIVLENGAWVGARAVVLPGVTLASHAVLSAGSVLSANAEPYTIYAGNPAVAIKKRVIKEQKK